MKKVIGFDHGLTPMICEHTFEIVDGKLQHKIDGVLRAVIGQDSFAEYAQEWPECISVIAPPAT